MGKLIRSRDGKEWETLIEEKSDAYLADISLTKDFLLLKYTRLPSGQPQCIAQPLENGATVNHIPNQRTLKFPNVDPDTTAHVADMHSTNWDDNDIRITIETPSMPSVTYIYNYGSSTLRVLK